ncbi:MAG: hypothetical protein IJW35_05350 [Lentisphaeria bacterium]|nr:hypothetical protein [Lentisphaeria bacterium]
MKSMLFTVIALLMAVQVSAFDLNQAKPGMLFGPADPERARLFTDQKPVQNFLQAVRKKPQLGMVTLTGERELKFSCLPGKTDANCNVALPFPETKKVLITFEIKGDNFFTSKKSGKNYARFMIACGGANLFVRGDTRDLRYFDGNAKKYLRLTPMKNGEWLKVALEVNCTGEPVFSLNDKKDVAMRTKSTAVKNLSFAATFFAADTTVTIKNLKVSAL